MGSQVGRHLGRPSDNPTLEVLQVTKGSGSMEPDHEQIRVGFGHWTVARALAKDEFKSFRFVVSLEEDDFGGLCPRIGLEAKGLVHSDGCVAAIVPTNDCDVVLPPPRPSNGAQTAAGQQQSAARASFTDHSGHTGTSDDSFSSSFSGEAGATAANNATGAVKQDGSAMFT